jgi:integrase
MILKAGRIGEALGVRFDEIDLEAKVWTVPAERMKSGKEHRVPLAARVVDVMKTMAETRQKDFAFPGMKQGRPLPDIGTRKLVERGSWCMICTWGLRATD